MKHTKLFSLVVLAALAATAFVAVSASAEAESPVGFFYESGTFKAESYPLNAAAEQTGSESTLFEGSEFGPRVNCSKAEYLTSSAITGSSSSISNLLAEYSSCIVGASSAVSVANNQCSWTLASKYSNLGAATLNCPSGKKLEFKRYNSNNELKCTIAIPPQGPISGVSFGTAGSGSGRSVAVTMYLTGIDYTTTINSGPVVTCGEAGTFSTGTLSTQFNLKDYRNFI